MDRLHGLIGIALILGIAFLASNNRSKINLRLVLSGIGLQAVIALLIFHVSPVAKFFQLLGDGIGVLEQCARKGAGFVFGGLVVETGPGKFINYAAGGFTFVFDLCYAHCVILSDRRCRHGRGGQFVYADKLSCRSRIHVSNRA